MKKTVLTLAFVVSVVYGATFVGNAGAQRKGESSFYEMGYFELGPEHISHDGKWLMAFVPTGRPSPDQILSVSVSVPPFQPPSPVTTREPSIDVSRS